ncbi:MAG: group III truncated hemoglobin [Sulfurimonas sp.]|jgi:hemoglobin|uniref:group III truncated hemoglobin n=1 Tax=Sulfurimonas sp. TaxID=2022749 RepID=UPI0026136EF9|nr:group III truncated hemoglobin [Sulfurimonas sp.]MDD3475744.1 group III truncated hemoglobin [Sulfurimonas sp.]
MKVEKMLYNEVTKENLNKMVLLFYSKVLKDIVVAPFFIEKLGDDMKNDKWRPHLEILTNFWASIALGDSAYRGSPFAPHLDIEGISREAFQGWLRLFYETQDSIYVPEIADFFKNRSTLIAGNFMRNLGV